MLVRESSRSSSGARYLLGPPPVALAALLIAGACGGGGSLPAQRLIAVPPDSVFERASLFTEEEVAVLDLTDPAERRRWRRSDGGPAGESNRGAEIPGPSGDAWLVRSLEGIGPCDAVTTDTGWLREGDLELALTTRSPPAAEVEPVEVAGPRELFDRDAPTRFHFSLPALDPAAEEGAGGWLGLRLSRGRAGLGLVRVRCLRRRADPEALTRALARPWRVDIDGEVRFAVVALPGQPARFGVEVPRGGRLRFGYGVEPDQPEPIEIAAVIRAEGGEEAVAFTSGTVEPGSWHDGEADLADFEGRRVVIELRATAAGAVDPLRGLAFVAHPEVYGDRAPKPPPSVVLISVDTLRADRLELYGYERPTMPRLTQWARRRAVVFEQAVVQAPWTLPSHVSMLTGLDPLVHGVNFHRRAPERLELLSELLYRRGYRTAAVTGGAYLDPQFGLDQGFERFVYFRGGNHFGELEGSVEAALDWLRREGDDGRPFFLFFHTYDVHEPLAAREPFYRQLTGEPEPDVRIGTRGLPPERRHGFATQRELIYLGKRKESPPSPQLASAMYDSAVAHTDAGVARLLTALDELGIADDTAVIFTSDHGEALGEHGLIGHGYLYDHNALVPLVVQFPGRTAAGSRVTQQVRSIDLVPTLLELLELPTPGPLSGRSLMPLVRGVELPEAEATVYNAIANHGLALREDGIKYVLADPAWKPTASPVEQLFDLRSDSGEEHPITAESDRLRRLRRAAIRVLHRTATGLRLRFENPGPDELCVLIRSDVLRLDTVKVLGTEDFVDWAGVGQATLRLPAGEATTVLVLDVTGGELGLALEPWRRCWPARFEPLAVDASFGRLTEGLGYRLGADGRWHADSLAAGVAGATFWLSWVGPLPEVTAEAEPPDPELEARLRALGYL